MADCDVTVTIWLPAELEKRVQAQAIADNSTVKELMLEAVRKDLQRNSRPIERGQCLDAADP